MDQRSIRQTNTPTKRGADGQVKAKRMVIEPGAWEATDPFLFLAEDWFAKPGGFPDHPHRGIETITFVLDGQLRHADNRGNSGVLARDDVQWMTAGGGIIHAELPHLDEDVHSLQLWVNMPSHQKMIDSSYQDLVAGAALRQEEAGATIRVISGQVEGVDAEVHNSVPVLYLDVILEPGARRSLPVPAAHNGFAYVLAGEARFGAIDPTPAHAEQVVWLDYPTPTSGESVLKVEAGASGARFLLVTGEPIREPVVAYGPFVMNTPEEIEQAFRDYQSGLFGGPTAAMLEG